MGEFKRESENCKAFFTRGTGMDYGLRGIKNKNKEINAIGSKISRKISSLMLKLAIGAVDFISVCGE